MEAIYEYYLKKIGKKRVMKAECGICNRVNACLKTYETYKKRDVVPFSRFVIFDINHYAIPKTTNDDSDFKEGIRNKIHKFEKFINLYKQENYKEPNFANKTVLHWFMKQLKWTEKQLKRIIYYSRVKNVSLDAPLGEENDNTLESTIQNPNDPSTDNELWLKVEIELYQEVWELEKKEINRQRISSLVTWHFLKHLSYKDRSCVTKDFLLQYDIFDKEILARYFNGGWQNDSFLQKDIANMLNIKPDRANKILNDFLKEVEIHNQL